MPSVLSSGTRCRFTALFRVEFQGSLREGSNETQLQTVPLLLAYLVHIPLSQRHASHLILLYGGMVILILSHQSRSGKAICSLQEMPQNSPSISGSSACVAKDLICSRRQLRFTYSTVNCEVKIQFRMNWDTPLCCGS